MDAISNVTQAQQASVQSQIQYAIYAKQLDAMREQASSLISLLEGSVELSKESGKGENFDGLG